MDFLNQAMLFLLDTLHGGLGSYALAIIVLTVLIRAVLWPLNSAQTRSMKVMQQLQPKMKELQDKHKDDPMKMQQELMKFYSENKFNPLSGCLPTLVQIPIFIALYGALMSPDFITRAGDESFLFIQKLHHTLKTAGGDSLDGTFNVEPNAKFTAGHVLKATYVGQAEPQDIKVSDLYVNDVNKLLRVTPRPLIPGEPATVKLLQVDLGYDDTNMQRLESVDVPVTNPATRELETITLTPNAEKDALTAEVPTQVTKPGFNIDVILLIALYAALSFGFQKTMSLINGATTPKSGPQALMMKFMPLMFVAFLFFVPVPAGVILYLIVAMVMMMLQNLWLWYRDKDKSPLGASSPKNEVVEVKAT